MKKYIMLILFIMTICSVTAQTVMLDSLKRSLKNDLSDSLKLELIREIGNQYLFVNSDSAIRYFEDALVMAREEGFKTTEIRVKSSIARALNNIGNYPEALRLSIESVNDSEVLGDSVTLWFSKRQIMWIYRDMGDKEMELKYCRELLQLAEKFPDEPKYLPYDEMSFRLIGTYFIRTDQMDSAFHYYSKSYNLAQKLPNHRQAMVFNTRAMGEYYLKKEQYDSALYFFEWSNSMVPEFSRNDVSITNLLNMADIYLMRNETSSGLINARTALSEAQAIPDTLNMVNALNKVARAYEQMMQFDSAYSYLRLSTELQIGMASQAKINSAANLMFNETLYKQQVANELKQADERLKSSFRIYALLGSAIVLIIISILLYRNVRQKRKDTAAIQESYNQLKSTQAQLIQSEKMASLGQLTAGIAHEIQNPLNFVNNFSEVSSELVEEVKESRAKSQESRLKTKEEEIEDEILEDIKLNLDKITFHGKRADAIVKGMLEHSKTGSGEKELTDINTLAKEYSNLAYQSFKSKNEEVEIELITNFDPTLPPLELVRPEIGKVLLNILNNAFYASAIESNTQQSRSATVSLSTKNLGHKIEISIEDNGPGIPDAIKDKIFQPFFTTKPTGQGTGLGLSLSYDIVKAHGGEIRVETKEGEGSTFIFQLPI